MKTKNQGFGQGYRVYMFKPPTPLHPYTLSQQTTSVRKSYWLVSSPQLAKFTSLNSWQIKINLAYLDIVKFAGIAQW